MKKMISLTMLIIAISFAAVAEDVIRKGETHSALGKYTIEESNDLVVVNGEELNTFTISFENSIKTIKVAIDKDKKGKVKNFIVMGEDLSLQYTCQSSHFGVSQLDKKYQEAGVNTSNEELNLVEYYHQKVLTRSNPTDRDCLGLIACFYPKLVINYEDAFACK